MMIDRRKKKLSKKPLVNCSFSESKINAMKLKAKQLSNMIAQNSKSTNQLPENSCINNEDSSTINTTLSQNKNLAQNNDQFLSLSNSESSIPSCSGVEKKSPESNESPHYVAKRKKSKDLKTKHKKSKIPFLVKHDVYQDENIDDQTSKKQDDYVLEKLFNKSGMYYMLVIIIISKCLDLYKIILFILCLSLNN